MNRLLLTALIIGCGAFVRQNGPSATRRPIRVLFLGNSLTAANDLPAIVQAMAASVGVKLTYEAVAPGGFNLEDHWGDNQSLPALDRGGWDYVVLQQGPSSLPESQADLKKWAVPWADRIRVRKAKPLLYMVWPFQGQKEGFRLVSQSYRNAAKAAGAEVLPAGEAWDRFIAANPGIPLYQPDHLHPTLAGTYLAALVITRTLTGTDPARIPPKIRPANGQIIDLGPDVTQKLKSAIAQQARSGVQ